MNRERIARPLKPTAGSASAAVLLLLSLTFAACGGGRQSTPPPPPINQFELEGWGTLKPLVTAGSSTTFGIAGTPALRGPVPATVAVTISGMPSGLTVSPDSFSLVPNGANGQVVVTITAASSLLPGAYPITVAGTNQSASNSITVTVGVVEPTPPPIPLQANVIYSFSGPPDASAAAGPLIPDNAGNLYGVTPDGGTNELGGTVFELSFSNGTWQKTVLYRFDDGQPVGALVFDDAGNLYGATMETGNLCNPSGCSGASDGTVYELTPTGSGWQRTVLHTFGGSPDGEDPGAGLGMDKAGNLYGTTKYGGDSKIECGGTCGTVFTLQRSGSGWAYSVIHKFEFADGASPQSELVVDPQGNLYGTTFTGGDQNCPWIQRGLGIIAHGPECGTVFEMTLSGGVWQEKTVYTFHASYEGAGPSGLVLDAAGNLYGLTTFGGFDTALCAQCGNFFQLTPNGNGWTLSQLYEFLGGDDGLQPGDLIRDQAGNIYGLTPNGGPPNCGDSSSGYYGCGTVVRLSQTGGLGQTGQGWVATGSYDFPGGAAGWLPSSLTLSGGHLYGTTWQGGSPGLGLIFEISP
jgi:uncharacterized repeat protein (TIGR03803 family)